MREEEAPGRPVLAAAALGAAALYQFLLLFPLALMFALPTLWFGHGFMVAAAVLGFAVMAWVVQPAGARAPPTLPRAEAPALYEMADTLADRLGAPRVHAIALDDEPNAAALELNRGLSLRPTRRVLVLGRPLLALMDAPALAAVVAHELGHFSRRHGRLGHWLYRTRLAWVDYADAAADPDLSAWERAGVAFAERFVPWFARASFAHARRNEFEADALAAQACGAPAFARALRQVEAIGSHWRACHEVLADELQRQHAEPPADWLARLADRLRVAATGPLAAELADDDDPHATHPPTAARLQALGVAADAALSWPRPEAGAGPAWLGGRWPEQAVDRRWHAAAARHDWRCRHVLLQHAPDPPEAGSPEAQRHRQALELLAAGQAAAAHAAWQALLADAPAWAVPVRRALARHAAALQLAPAERQENLQLLQRGLGRLSAAAGRMQEARRRGEFGAPPLTPAARAALAAALASHPVLQAAWCVGVEARLDERRRYRGLALVLRVVAARLDAEGMDADELADRVGALATLRCEADVVVTVAVRYASEPVPEEFSARPEALLFAKEAAG